METRTDNVTPISTLPAQRSQPRHGWSRERFCEYLRESRDHAAMSIEDIARVTKIPERSLRYLEDGTFEKLPADVFVRGFLRSYARCVGIDAEDVVRRYANCGLEPAPVASDMARSAQEQLNRLAADVSPDVRVIQGGIVSAEKVVEEPSAEPQPRKRRRRARRGQGASSNGTGSRKRLARGTGDVTEDTAGNAALARAPKPASAPAPAPAKSPQTRKRRRRARAASGAHAIIKSEPSAQPVATSPTVASGAAEQPVRQRTFLPPAWSEQDDASKRGPLTLAVIILVIVATLTMSYLLRRPSYSGDGVTQAPTTEQRIEQTDQLS